MPRIMINGVIWNREEELIIQAGVVRYGDNQWERIIPLLPGKTIEQCKERWEMGLKNNIKKTEWTPAEDAELLRLVGVMSAKWMDIAWSINRTSIDCLKRYEYLSKQAQKKMKNERDAVADRRKFLPKRIPCIPLVTSTCADHQQNDLEKMLSKLRTTIAKRQVKTAKLLERERRLEVTRRLENVRKRRERIQAKRRRAEENRKQTLNFDSESSTNSESEWCHRFYSAEEFVDPLKDIFMEMQQRDASSEFGMINEEPVENEETIKRPYNLDNFVDELLGGNEPPSKRRKVIVIQKPNIPCEEIQQVLAECERDLKSTGRTEL